MVLPTDLRELLRSRTVFLHVLAPRVTEHLWCRGRFGEAAQLDHQLEMLVHGIRPIGVFHTERSLLHLLESECQRTVCKPALHKLLRHEESGRACRTVVVHVVERDAGKAEAVHRTLSTRGV